MPRSSGDSILLNSAELQVEEIRTPSNAIAKAQVWAIALGLSLAQSKLVLTLEPVGVSYLMCTQASHLPSTLIRAVPLVDDTNEQKKLRSTKVVRIVVHLPFSPRSPSVTSRYRLSRDSVL